MTIEKSKLLKIIWEDQNAIQFADYCYKLQTATKDWKLVNYFAKDYTEDQFAKMYNLVANEWLVFDWVHITIGNNGISYDYVAYKNKMLLAYPESKIDIDLIHKWDEFKLGKDSWKITYTHTIADPFSPRDENIIWVYVVIKNNRGEFITTLWIKDLEKHKRVAKTQFIWNAWFAEMCIKTVMKKACKMHFNDIYEKIEEQDNTQSDLELVNIEPNLRDIIDSITNIEDLRELKKKNQWLWKEIDDYFISHANKLKWSTTANKEQNNG